MLLRAANASNIIGKSLAALVLEAFVWKELTSGRQLEWRPLNQRAEELALAEDQFKAESVQRFDKLRNVVKGADRLLQVPRAANLEAVDALMGPDICYQVTCSASHRETAKGLIAAFQALDSDGMADDKAPKLVFAVPKKTYKKFAAQPVALGVGCDGVSPVKSGPQLKVEGLVAQFVLAVDFVPDV